AKSSMAMKRTLGLSAAQPVVLIQTN
ncbi:uncharacterized protein METZ01_LOCUS191206, partial [marine metagenome]